MVAPDGTVLSVNPFGAEQLGYTVRELVGERVMNVSLPEDHDVVRERLRGCLARVGQVVTWEMRKVRKDGAIIWVRETANAMQRSKGSSVVLIACEDISSRKRTESKLLENERRYRQIFQATGVSIWEEDVTGVHAAIEPLKQNGVADFRSYLETHPDFIDRALALVRVIDVNEATLKLFGAASKDQLVSSLATVFTPETKAAAEMAPTVIVDIGMPLLNGLDAGEQLKALHPHIKVIYLTQNRDYFTQNRDPRFAAEAFRRHASGYLLKDSAASELTTAIREPLRGHAYVSPAVSKGVRDADWMRRAVPGRELNASGKCCNSWRRASR